MIASLLRDHPLFLEMRDIKLNDVNLFNTSGFNGGLFNQMNLNGSAGIHYSFVQTDPSIPPVTNLSMSCDIRDQQGRPVCQQYITSLNHRNAMQSPRPATEYDTQFLQPQRPRRHHTHRHRTHRIQQTIKQEEEVGNNGMKLLT